MKKFLSYCLLVILLIVFASFVLKLYMLVADGEFEYKEQGYQLNKNLNLSYVSYGDPKSTNLLFIHGTPGRWDSFIEFFKQPQLAKDFHLVAIDRLGWGQSELSDEQLTYQFVSHSQAIASLLKLLAKNKRKTILVGHSLGASLASRVALDNPELVDGVILLAGTLNPELAEPRWFNRLASYSIISWLLPKQLNKANQEIMALKKETSQTALAWADYQAATIQIQGMQDELVYPENANYLQKHLSHLGNKFEVIKLQKADHFLPWNQVELVTKKIYQMKSWLKDKMD